MESLYGTVDLESKLSYHPPIFDCSDMSLTADIFEKKLLVDHIFENGCLLDLVESVRCSGSKELLTIFAENEGFEKLFACSHQSAVLDFFVELATLLVNSYDERLGIVSALIYYLCERDKYSIDIMWTWREAKRLERFLLWLEPLLNDERALAMCEFVLNNFPATRITPLMWQGLTKIMPRLLNSIAAIKPERGSVEAGTAGGDRNPPIATAAGGRNDSKNNNLGSQSNQLHVTLFTDEQLLAVGSDILLSACYFGLGLEFREFARTDLLIFDKFSAKIKDQRCTDTDCEFLRVARKAIRSRDESPIPENAAMALDTLRQMHKDGLLARALKIRTLAQLIDAANGVLTIDLDNTLLNVFAVLHACENGPPQIYDTLVKKLGSELQELDDVIIKHQCVDCYLKGWSSRRFAGLPRGLSLWLIHYLEQAKNNALKKLLDESRVASSESTCSGAECCDKADQGVQESIQSFASLCMKWARTFAEQVKSMPRNLDTPFDDSVTLPFLALVHHAYQSSLRLRPECARSDKDYCADEYVCSWSSDDSSKIASAIGHYVDLFESFLDSQIRPPPKLLVKRALAHLTCIVSNACGVHEYTQVPELRRHVMYPAGGATGLLLDKVRTLKRLETLHSDCSVVRQVLDISLMRCEQASGLRLVVT